MKTIKLPNIVWLLLVSAIIFLMHLDVLMVNIMEARNFGTAREMLASGDWIFTTLNGVPRYEKPPLPVWLTAISASIFGMKNVFFLRLPAAIMGIILILITYRFSKNIVKKESLAFIGGLILVTSFYIISAGRDANWDIFTHTFMMGCIYFLHQLLSTEKYTFRYALLAALLLGCSFLSKGPVSLYALLLPFLIAYGVTFKYGNLRNKIVPLVVFIIVGGLISGSWYGYVYVHDAETILAINQKEATNWTSLNVRPFYYYWSFFTQSGMWIILSFVGLLYPYLKNKVSSKKGYQFTLLWTLLSVILLSIIPEKKSRYLLPVLIPLALNTAFYMEYLILKFSTLKDWREKVPVYFNYGILGFASLIFPIGSYLILKGKLEGHWGWFICINIIAICVCVVLFKLLFQKNIKKLFYLNIVMILVSITFGLPLVHALLVNPEYTSFAELKQWSDENTIEIYEFDAFTPEIIWQYGSPITMITDKNNVVRIPSEISFGVLIAEKDKTAFNRVFAGFQTEKVKRYDINPHPPESRSHKTRLWRDLYVVTKK